MRFLRYVQFSEQPHTRHVITLINGWGNHSAHRLSVMPQSNSTDDGQLVSLLSIQLPFGAHLFDKEIILLFLGASSYLPRTFSFDRGATP